MHRAKVTKLSIWISDCTATGGWAKLILCTDFTISLLLHFHQMLLKMEKGCKSSNLIPVELAAWSVVEYTLLRDRQLLGHISAFANRQICFAISEVQRIKPSFYLYRDSWNTRWNATSLSQEFKLYFSQ